MDKEITKHFNIIAKDYDKFKERYSYYYAHLKTVVSNTVAHNLHTLEVGCGTGELLNCVSNNGTGIDVSEEMVKIARIKYPHLIFKTMAAEDLNFKDDKFDLILMIGIAEHLTSLSKAIQQADKVSNNGASIIITTIHPVYRHLLTWGGILGLKMDEGKHRWVPVGEIKRLLELNNFRVTRVFNDLCFPIEIPAISCILNNSFLNDLFGMTQFVVAVKD